jgi:hypothetical protein
MTARAWQGGKVFIQEKGAGFELEQWWLCCFATAAAAAPSVACSQTESAHFVTVASLCSRFVVHGILVQQ